MSHEQIDQDSDQSPYYISVPATGGVPSSGPERSNASGGGIEGLPLGQHNRAPSTIGPNGEYIPVDPHRQGWTLPPDVKPLPDGVKPEYRGNWPDTGGNNQ